MQAKQSSETRRSSRRDFIKSAAAGTALAANLSLIPNVYAAGSDVIKIGIIGCGGRGTGAVDNCLSSAPNVKLVAMGDAFKDHLDSCLNSRALKKHGDKIDGPESRRFVGLDAFEKVIASEAN